MFQLDNNYYTDFNKYISDISGVLIPRSYQWRVNGGYHVLNVPCAFDIETTSFYSEEKKQAIMYIWQFAFNGKVVIGRTWKQFKQFLSKLEIAFNLDETNKLYVYVHNLGYEFQFMRYWFTWDNVFSTEERKPIRACLADSGIEFRDSYILSGYSLEKVGENLQKYKVKKLVGNLDYEQIRTPLTKLTKDEISYCINDVLVVSAYIQEQIEEYGQITKIPLTQTGKVRKFCRDNCFNGFSKNREEKKKVKQEYKKIMHNLSLTTEEYMLCKWAFQGGFTHANVRYVKHTQTDVESQDFTSSYPATMVLEMFPMGKGTKVKIKSKEEFYNYDKNYCMIMIVRLTGITQKIYADCPISFSKCKIDNDRYRTDNDYRAQFVVNNGRISEAPEIEIACTNFDLRVYERFYNIKHIEILMCYVYAKWYLPRNFLLSILSLYKDKTQLKGVVSVDGSIERKYLHSKEMLNSCYGMCVTDIAKELTIYDSESGWNSEIRKRNGNAKHEMSKEELDSLIQKYNKNRNRFLYYPWGIFVTSYARYNLFSAIAELGDDYIYSDTDSVKFKNPENHKEYFKLYNDNIERKIQVSSQLNNIDIEMYAPLTSKGKQKFIGKWDFDGHYKYFKTLGAKRYIYFDDDLNLHCTVAGCGKVSMQKYLLYKYKTPENILKIFDDGLYIPCEYYNDGKKETGTNKNTHTYIDNEMSGIIIDKDGTAYEYYEKSGIHLEKTDFTMSMSDMFLKYIMGVQQEYEL